MFLECAFVLPPGIADSAFTLDYLLQFAIVVSVAYGKMFLPRAACPCELIRNTIISVHLCESSSPSEYKLSDALNKAGYWMKL